MGVSGGSTEKWTFTHFLVKREDERAQENQELKDMVKELRDTHKQDVKTQASLMNTQSNLLKSIDNLTNQVADLTNQNKTLQQKVNDLLSQISVGNKVRFGSKSQKGVKKNAAPAQDREKDKDDFDGTNGAAMSSVSQLDTSPATDAEAAEQPQKNYDNRKGMKYRTMYADNRVVHESDTSLLPEGSTIIKSVFESTYEQVSYIIQHDYEMIIYKDKDGVMRKGYFPKAEESAEIDRIPGTHASCSLLANLVFNKYHMNTPVYREMVRLLNNRMNVSRNTVYNWFVKGSEYLKKVLPILKEKLLAKGAVVHCDETWCRVKVNGKYGKKYIWSMVNELARVAVYFYDDGSRSRDVLREFLGNTEIDALQSDGYNVYMYIDNELINVDHLCCFATCQGKKDGRYNIDNSLAERSLRTMTVERKNSLGFGSHAGVEVSVIYHTFIETCKMCGVSTLEYFKEFFKAAIEREQRELAHFVEREQARIIFTAIMQGRTDYENLLPMTIGIKK